VVDTEVDVVVGSGPVDPGGSHLHPKVGQRSRSAGADRHRLDEGEGVVRALERERVVPVDEAREEGPASDQSLGVEVRFVGADVAGATTLQLQDLDAYEPRGELQSAARRHVVAEEGSGRPTQEL